MIARLRTIHRFAAILLALWATSAWADTLELRNGRTLTGQYAGGSKEEVRFQVRSQTLRFPLAEVSRLTIGGTGQENFRQAAKEVLQQLKAVASVAEAEVTYADYSRRVSDAKIKVDQFLDEHKPSPVPKFNEHVVESLGFYITASTVWKIKASNAEPWQLVRDPYILKCAPVQKMIDRENASWAGKPTDARNAVSIKHSGIPPLWECARNSILDAEKALSR